MRSVRFVEFLSRWHQRPIIQIKQDIGQVFAALAFQRAHVPTLCCHQPQTDRANARGFRFCRVEDFGPCAHRIACERGISVGTCVDRHHKFRALKPVERQRAGQRYDVAAIDQALAFGSCGHVEMHFGGVLPQARRHHVFGFFKRHAVNVVDNFTDFIIAKPVRCAGFAEAVIAKIEALGHSQFSRRHVIGQIGHNSRR